MDGATLPKASADPAHHSVRGYGGPALSGPREVEPALLARSRVGGAKGFRVRPGPRRRPHCPGRMGDEYRRLRIAGALQQMEMSKAGHTDEVAVALAPDLDRFGLAPGAMRNRFIAMNMVWGS
jgi:hypothetical protein